MSTKDTTGKNVSEDLVPSIIGEEGISASETATDITLAVDIPALTSDSAPDVNNDYIVFHGSVSDERKKMLLAYIESLGSLSCKVDVFAAPTNEYGVDWYKPAGAKIIAVTYVGGGGGGGSGILGAASTDRAGGGGGGGGQLRIHFFPAEIVLDVGRVIVGRGGKGAAATRLSSEVGRAGSVGEPSYVNILQTQVYLAALNGGAGAGVTPAGNAGGAAGGSGSGAGGTGDDVPATGTVGGNATLGGSGGGGGGGFDSTSNVASAGSAGGIALGAVMTPAAAGSAGGGHGSPGENNVSLGGGGGGGGGSSSDTAVNGGDGGDGGWPGGGGGGGGSATSGNNAWSGRGGYGADGLVLIISYF